MSDSSPRRSVAEVPQGWLVDEILATLWATPDAMTPAQVQAALPRNLAYTTVMTVLQRLHAKGVVRRERQGRAYAYRPVVAAAESAAGRMRAALDSGRDRAAVLHHFISALSAEDEETLSKLLRKNG